MQEHVKAMTEIFNELAVIGEEDRVVYFLASLPESFDTLIHYDETFCPVVRFESLHTVIAIAVQNSLIKWTSRLLF